MTMLGILKIKWKLAGAGGGGRYRNVEKPNPGSAEKTEIIAARPNESISSQTVLEGGQSG